MLHLVSAHTLPCPMSASPPGPWCLPRVPNLGQVRLQVFQCSLFSEVHLAKASETGSICGGGSCYGDKDEVSISGIG